MSAAGRGPPPPPPPRPPSADAEAFDRLVNATRKKVGSAPPPKFVKKLDEIPEIELPPEKTIPLAVGLAERALIGQFTGLWPSPRATNAWVQHNWRPLIKEGVLCLALGRGYFLFDFAAKSDRDLIFRNGPYFMGPQGLYLTSWSPDFDPAMDVPKAVPVWVRLPNLPMHCWGGDSLETIGNRLGKYIDHVTPKEQYSFARVCVEVDLEAGLPEAVKLTIKGWQHYQQVDYEQLPFKCRHCHEHGHFQRNCPKIQEPETEKSPEEGWQQSKKQKANSRRRGTKGISQAPIAKDPTSTAPETSKNQEGSPSSRQGNSFAALEEQEPKDKEIEEGEVPPSVPSSPARRLEDKTAENPNLEIEVVNLSKEDGTQEATNDEGTEEDGTDEEDLDHSGTAKKERRGRKTDRERREAAAYRDRAAGTQTTIEKHLKTRITRLQGNASKGATTSSKGK